MAEKLTTPPGKPSQPYIIPCYSGELWTIPTSNSTMRLLVTGKESNNAFAVVGTGGTFDGPIGFHFHKEAHDVFLCLQGKINVWADDKARSLYPGDFASVPPVCIVPRGSQIISDIKKGTIHQYQIDSEHSEFIGLIVPGGWEEFFRFVGEPYAGPLFPTTDKRNPFEVLIPKLIAATEKFDMIPVRDKDHFDPQPWDGTETKLPGVCDKGGYFLKEGSGDKFAVGGAVVRPLATRKETNGRFSIYSLEVSSHHRGGFTKFLEFKETHHAIYVVSGILGLAIDGVNLKTTPGETTFLPAGTKWSFDAGEVYAQVYVFANGGGLGEILTAVGSKYELAGLPQIGDSIAWDEGKLKSFERDLNFKIL
jgi:quercetin dioxygenase-like cupin family protein